MPWGTILLYFLQMLSIVIVLLLARILTICCIESSHTGAHHHRPRNIFIDLGTNDGESILAFVKGLSVGGLATDGSSTLQGGWAALINSTSHNMNSSSWDVVAFEANDKYSPKIREISTNLLNQNKVHSFRLYGGTAISTYDGQVEFIYDGKWASAGSTTMGESRSAIGKKIVVPTIDINTLFHQLEHIRPSDFVVLKIDIEGAEYDLVRRIITSGLWRLIDRMAVEW